MMKGKAINPEEIEASKKNPGYPNSFLFGVFCGVFLNMGARMGSYEPLHARPFSYITTGLVLGFGMYYYDYWRRKAIEEVMVAEERFRYHRTLKALNQVRAGEEDEITNLIEYLSNSTVRE